MDQFTEMMNTEFDLEASDYLDKLLHSLELTQVHLLRTGQDPMSMRQLAQKIMAEVRPDNLKNFSTALAAAMFRLQEK